MQKISGLIYRLLTVACLFLATNCVSTGPDLPAAHNPADIVPARHLIFIGLDGWGGKYLPKADMPTVKRMMKHGASSIYQYNVMPSNSRENWTALFFGAELEDDALGSFPSIFSIVNERKKSSSVFFYEWDWLDRIASGETTEKHKILSDEESARLIAAHITEKKPVFTAVVFNEPDSVGHNKVWGSSAYKAKLAELDSYIALIEQAAKDAGIYDDTVFVLSSDHGGSLFGHGFNLSSHRRIPLVIYGKIIKEGYVIPPKGSICNIAPTMAVILGLDVPSGWTGQPISGVFQ